MGHHEHKEKAKIVAKCFVLTVSDTRTPADDESGQMIKTLVQQGGHEVSGYAIVRDDEEKIREKVEDAIGNGADAVIVTGGTGITSRDVTVDALSELFDFELRGFGELFRAISYDEIGPSAMMSRATAGVIRGNCVVFCLPGSVNAVQLAVKALIIKELSHIIWEIRR